MPGKFALNHVDDANVGIRLASSGREGEEVASLTATDDGVELAFGDELPPAFGGGVVFDTADDVAAFASALAAAVLLLGKSPKKRRRR